MKQQQCKPTCVFDRCKLSGSDLESRQMQKKFDVRRSKLSPRVLKKLFAHHSSARPFVKVLLVRFANTNVSKDSKAGDDYFLLTGRMHIHDMVSYRKASQAAWSVAFDARCGQTRVYARKICRWKNTADAFNVLVEVVGSVAGELPSEKKRGRFSL